MTRFLRVIDLETTGNSFTDGGVVEIGWQDVAQGENGDWSLRGAPGALLIDPANPISPATSAIHHLIDEDVAGAPRWLQAAPAVLCADPGPAPIALVAHRAAFEQRWCSPILTGALTGRLPWICTYKCALRIWPDAPGHSNQGLRYWRRPAGLDRQTGLPAHRAGPDAYVTAHHVRDMLGVASLSDLLRWSGEPALLVRVPYGKLRGRRFAELAEDALASLADTARGDGDVLFTVRTEQRRRANIVPAEPAPVPQGALQLPL